MQHQVFGHLLCLMKYLQLQAGAARPEIFRLLVEKGCQTDLVCTNLC